MPSDVVRFGNDLELDRHAYELRQSGRPLKLERIPMELLLFLVERKGQLVTREQIIERIWGKDLFFDTDNSINAAVRKIRQVLKDDSENPLFVQTITGKGYRFVAPVVELQLPVEAHWQTSNRNATSADLIIEPKTAAPIRLGKAWRVIAAAVVLALSVAAFLFFHSRRSTKLTEKDTIVLADFTNTTGDRVFDATLREGMVVQLEQSPFVSLVPEARIQHTLRLMGQPADARLTPEIAREICERTGSIAVLEGSIAALGTQYVLGLRANNCRTGDIVDEEQAQVARKEDVLNALSRIASKFRARAGESLTMVEKHDIPLAEATTPSLEALKAYSAAWETQSPAGSAGVVPLFKRAIEIDPHFAVAYAALGRMYGDIGEYELSAENTRKAYELRERVSDREKFGISASYDLVVTGNIEKAQQTCELWGQTYPRDASPHAFLSGMVYPIKGNYEKAIEEASRAIALDPGSVVGYWILAYAYEYTDRLAEAENTLQRASERGLELPDFLVQRYDIAFLKSDLVAKRQAAALGEAKTGADALTADHEAFVMAYSGQLQQARRLSRRAEELARQAGHSEEAALFEAGAALREGFFGNAQAARQRATTALELSKGREVTYGAAFALALAGDTHASEKLAGDLERRFPEDTSVRLSYLPALQARLALNHREAGKAIELLQASVPYELGAPNSSMYGFFGALYPVYVRGEAYLAAHKGAKAAAEFQKIIDHRGIVVSDPIGALARLQLGRAYALSGDTAKGKSAYQDFLTLWRDADSEIPILIQAKKEYAQQK